MELSKGESVFYHERGGQVRPATVLQVHRDDPAAVYYTITVDGREKQSEHSRLSRDGCMGGERASGGGGWSQMTLMGRLQQHFARRVLWAGIHSRSLRISYL